MHYYNRNLGDYAKKAGRLSMLQHGAYTLLLDACYDRERFPTESEAIEWTWASTPDEEQAVKFVLSRFFERQEDGTYVQSRARDELLMFKIGGIQNRLIAISREAKKQNRDNLAKACDQLRSEIKNAPYEKTHEAWTRVVDALIKKHEAPPNQEPRTNNQEPIKDKGADKPAPFQAKTIDLPSEVNREAWQEWCKFRSSKRKPVSASAATMQIKLLSAHTPGVQRQMVEHSISNDYTGLFPPKPGLSAVPSTRKTSIEDDLLDTSWAN